ncbi:MAG TPA: two-component regulator propeller domain-containing protein, partial [Bryobacteraceae bacterium]|nr:two-component regulator propeller domain-containing protein [Bryobacteraceae bacterium]
MTRDHAGRVLAAALNVILRFTAGNTGRGASSGRVGGLAISIAETEDGVVWLGMRDNGLFRVHRDSRLQVSGLPDQKINALLAGTGSELWIGTDSGLVRWNGSAATQHGVPDQLAHGPILALARDRDSNLWVSTRSDIVRVDTHGISSTLAGHFGVGAIHAMFEDREGNLWLGGPGGLVQLRDSPFVTYEGLNGGALHVDDDGRAWFAPSGGGLLWTDGRARHAISVAGLDTDVIYSICSGSEHLWVGRRLGGLTRLREVEGQFTAKTYSTEDGIARGGIYALHCSGDGSVWAGSLAGSITRIHQGRISTFTSSDGLSGEAITTINETPDGVIWAGTAGGLHSFDGGAWKSLTGADGLPPGRVNSLVVDEKGVLWIGAAAGLLYWTGTRAEPLSQAAELLRAEILGIVSDRRGNLWVASEGHIFRVARDSLLTKRKALTAAVREFGTADGLPSTRAVRRDHPVRIDPSGRIWFALHGGVSVIDPTRARVLPPASVIVESITVDGQPLKHETLARYTADRRRIVFNFNGLSLSFPDRVRYRYRLDDYDSDWSQPTQSREVAYTNLPPGRYTFRLMASNGEGLWNGSEVSVAFEAEPRFWQTWWFRVAGAILALTAMVTAYRYRLSRIRAAMNLRFEERLAERTRIAQELHDTLLQGFVSASMQLEVAADLLPENAASRPL